MTRQEFIKKAETLVQEYIDNFDRFDHNPQLRVNVNGDSVELVNGSDMNDEVEDNDEAVENAAIAQGAATEEYTEFQVEQNPDFYAVKKLLRTTATDKTVPDALAIARIADSYQLK